MIGTITGVVTSEEFETFQVRWQEYLRQRRDALLVELDAIERMMGRTPRTATIRKWAKPKLDEIVAAEVLEEYA
jgi:hypothetical protein